MKREKRSYLRGLAVTLAVFALLFCTAWMLLGRLESTSEEAQMQMVRDAVKNALVTCYAVEGSYPMDLEHLKEHYGLAYDEDRFSVYYDAFASNILPDVRVGLKGAQGL